MESMAEAFRERILKTCLELGITPENYTQRFNGLLVGDSLRTVWQRLDAWLKGGTGRKIASMGTGNSTGVICLISEDRYGPPYIAHHEDGLGDNAELAVSDALDKIGAPK